MSKRKPVVVKLDKTVCEFKLVSNPVLTFAYKHGAAVVFGVDTSNHSTLLEFILRYRAGEIRPDALQRNIKLMESDVIEAGGRFYEISSIQRCSKERMVYVTANRMAAAA